MIDERTIIALGVVLALAIYVHARAIGELREGLDDLESRLRGLAR